MTRFGRKIKRSNSVGIVSRAVETAGDDDDVEKGSCTDFARPPVNPVGGLFLAVKESYRGTRLDGQRGEEVAVAPAT